MGRSDAGTLPGPYPNMNNRNRFVILASGSQLVPLDLEGTKSVAKPFQITIDKKVNIPQHYLGSSGTRTDIATNEIVWATNPNWNENIARVETYIRAYFKDTL